MVATGGYNVIGKSVTKYGAPEMVTGRAAYGADVQLPGTLYGRILRSPHAHARIRRIDATRALQLEGVKAVVTGQDFPELPAGASFPMGELPVPLESIALLAMAKDKVLFHGHPVAAVAATDPYIADEALGLIEVDYEPLPVVLDLEQAMADDAPLVDETLYTRDMMQQVVGERPSNIAQHVEVERGDTDQALGEAGFVAEGEFRVGMAHQGYIEPPSTTARWEPDGRLTQWVSTQGIFGVQNQLAAILGLPQSKIRVMPMEVGGAFGGKIYVILEPVAALLSRKTGRPVKLTMTREEVLRATGPGSPMLCRARMGCTRDGRITAAKLWIALDAGCVPGSPLMPAVLCSLAAYSTMPNFRIDGYDVVTNKTRVHAYRGPGAPQAAFAVEQLVDDLADQCGLDPLEFRIRNAVGEGDTQLMGMPYPSVGLKEVLQRIRESDHWNSPLEGSNRGRGMAVGYWFGATMTSSSTIGLHRDGTVSLDLGSVDISGTRTSLRQIAAEALGIGIDAVHVMTGDTQAAPYTDVSGGSRITLTQSEAIHRAVNDLLAQLRPRAAQRLNMSEDDLEYGGGRFYGRGAREINVELKDLVLGPEGVVAGNGSSNMAVQGPAPTFSANLADVEVDPETGKVQILRYSCFQDCGLAVNPARVEAQMQGGALQGIGWALTEEYLYDDEGRVQNASLLDYRQPTALDVPMLECHIVEVPASHGPLGVRGAGEVPIVPPKGTLGNAVARAIGTRVRSAPMTPERVLAAVEQHRTGTTTRSR